MNFRRSGKRFFVRQRGRAVVEYCNGGIDTPMGARRAANGYSEPYNVRNWEIGNEVWWQWQVGTCSPDRFAERCISFAKAMKAADSSLVLLACGHTDQEWNETVLDIAGEHFDYLTLHLYHRYFSVRANKPTPIGLDALPDLDVAACANVDGSVVTVFIVNRSLQEVKVQLQLLAFQAYGDC